MRNKSIDKWVLLIVLVAALILIALILIVTPAHGTAGVFTSPFESPLETPTPTIIWLPDSGQHYLPGRPRPAPVGL